MKLSIFTCTQHIFRTELFCYFETLLVYICIFKHYTSVFRFKTNKASGECTSTIERNSSQGANQRNHLLFGSCSHRYGYERMRVAPRPSCRADFTRLSAADKSTAMRILLLLLLLSLCSNHCTALRQAVRSFAVLWLVEMCCWLSGHLLCCDWLTWVVGCQVIRCVVIGWNVGCHVICCVVIGWHEL